MNKDEEQLKVLKDIRMYLLAITLILVFTSIGLAGNM